jgi:hypothetical protein
MKTKLKYVKKNWVSFLLAVLLLSACGLPVRYTEVRGSGELATIMRPLPAINAVELDGIGRLIIQQGDRTSLEITAENNLINYLKTVPKGTSLHIYIEDHVNLRPTSDIIYRLTVKDLRRITVGGLGQIEVKPLRVDQLDIRLSGNNSVMIEDLAAGRFSLEASGLGGIEISGAVDSQDVRISGMGNYGAGSLQSRKARVEISGAGSALVWVTEEMDADLSGAGSIQYYGSPVVSADISGAGSVTSLGDK